MESSKVAPDDGVELEEVAALLAGFEKQRGNLIPILQLVQHKFSYLSIGAMSLVAAHLGVSLSEVYGVASFYNQFRFHPPGRHQIKVCMGTACHVAGGDIILENFERRLGIKVGETTPDRECSIESVACVGCCALAPVAVVDDQVHARVLPSKVEGLVLGFEREQQEAKGLEEEEG